MCCGSKAPDTSGMNAAAVAQAQLSREQLDWAKQIYAETAPQRAAAIERANKISDTQLLALQKQTALTDDYADYNKTTFRPLEQGLVDAAKDFDTPTRRDEAAQAATASVGLAFDAQQQEQGRQLARMGVNPNSGKAQALSTQTGLAKATAVAGASNKARNDVELQGYARKMDAANLGRGLASAQATSAGVALAQGNSAVGNAQAGGNITAQGNQIMTQGYAGAQGGLAGAASTYGNIASIENTANANASQNMMNMAKVGAMAFSDENMKEDRTPVSGKASLSAIRKIPVEKWKYKKGSAGDDGGMTHVGPMAQNVRRGLGNATAPGGKEIDLISMNGHTISALQAVADGQEKLGQRMSKVERRLGLASAHSKSRKSAPKK